MGEKLISNSGEGLGNEIPKMMNGRRRLETQEGKNIPWGLIQKWTFKVCYKIYLNK
jgi:hypothetical protein